MFYGKYCCLPHTFIDRRNLPISWFTIPVSPQGNNAQITNANVCVCVRVWVSGVRQHLHNFMAANST